MNTGITPPEIEFLKSPFGGAVVILVALAAISAVIIWALRPGHPERVAAVWAATVTSLFVAAITVIAVIAGWWRGSFFDIPLWVIVAIDLPLSIAGYTLWLSVYRWLEYHARRPLLLYSLIALLFIPVVFLVDPVQMQRGQFSMGSGYTIWMDALVGQAVMWSPVLAYLAIRRTMRVQTVKRVQI